MDALVIGAGVIGLATGAELARRGASVIVAEASGTIGSGISSRNSGVIHAGMYYAGGSLRAHHCVEGRRALYAYCKAHGVAHARPGKLIVATAPAEVEKLAAILKQGVANGVEGLEMIDGKAARGLEPELACSAALWSPQTGIVDSHALMLALKGEIEDQGGNVAFMSPVKAVRRASSGWRVEFAGSAGESDSCCPFDVVVNAAGLAAPDIARKTEGLRLDHIPRQTLAKGSYFAYSGRPVFRHLIYPAPVDGGLGTHVTLDLAGRMRFGPDVEWVEREAYDVDPARAASFYDAIRRYFPKLPDDSLVPDYAGIRPKLSGPGEAVVDFRIDGPEQHGLEGLVQLFGIESPGLTSALSIAGQVGDQLLGRKSAQRGAA